MSANSAKNDANQVVFTPVFVFNRLMIYFRGKIDRSTVPKGYYVYEVSYSPYDDNLLQFIGPHIREWFDGTIISNTPIELDEGGLAEIEDEDDVYFTCTEMTMDDYEDNCTAKR